MGRDRWAHAVVDLAGKGVISLEYDELWKWAIAGVVILFVLAGLRKGVEPGPQTDSVEIRPEPMDDMPDHAGVYLEGQKVGNITPNAKNGGWSATTSRLALHDIESRESAIAAVLNDHYQAQS